MAEKNPENFIQAQGYTHVDLGQEKSKLICFTQRQDPIQNILKDVREKFGNLKCDGQTRTEGLTEDTLRGYLESNRKPNL